MKKIKILCFQAYNELNKHLNAENCLTASESHTVSTCETDVFKSFSFHNSCKIFRKQKVQRSYSLASSKRSSLTYIFLANVWLHVTKLNSNHFKNKNVTLRECGEFCVTNVPPGFGYAYDSKFTRQRRHAFSEVSTTSTILSLYKRHLFFNQRWRV